MGLQRRNGAQKGLDVDLHALYLGVILLKIPRAFASWDKWRKFRTMECLQMKQN